MYPDGTNQAHVDDAINCPDGCMCSECHADFGARDGCTCEACEFERQCERERAAEGYFEDLTYRMCVDEHTMEGGF